MRSPSISRAISEIEQLSKSLNIPNDLDAPTVSECFVFWKVQSPIEDRLQKRKTLTDDQHTS